MATDKETIKLFLENKAGESPRLMSNGMDLWTKGVKGEQFAWWTDIKRELLYDSGMEKNLIRLFLDTCKENGIEYVYKFNRIRIIANSMDREIQRRAININEKIIAQIQDINEEIRDALLKSIQAKQDLLEQLEILEDWGDLFVLFTGNIRLDWQALKNLEWVRENFFIGIDRENNDDDKGGDDQ